MKFLNFCRPISKTDKDSEKASKAEPSTVGPLAVLSPPPYVGVTTSTSSPELPLLCVQGWKVYHGGIRWRISCDPYHAKRWYVNCDLVLVLQPPEFGEGNGIASQFRIDFVEDEDSGLQIKDSPFSSNHTTAMSLESVKIEDKLSKEMVSVSYHSGAQRVYLKVKPAYRELDKGIYIIRLELHKRYDWDISPRTRFAFHLEGSAVRPDPLRPSVACAKNPWTEPVRSDCVDKDRTHALAAKYMQELKRWHAFWCA